MNRALTQMLVLARFAAAHRECGNGRQTDEHVHDAFHNLPLAKERGHEVGIKETDEAPVQRTDDNQYPRELVNAAH